MKIKFDMTTPAGGCCNHAIGVGITSDHMRSREIKRMADYKQDSNGRICMFLSYYFTHCPDCGKSINA